MGLTHIIKYQFLRASRMLWYQGRYRFNKWKTIEGVSIPVYLCYGYSVLRFIDNGQYEHCEIGIIKDTIEATDTVLELGTGIGFVSAFCAKQIGGENVYTYEGNPAMEPLIIELYQQNGVFPQSAIAMLGEKNGTQTFYQDKKSFLASSATVLPGTTSIVVEVAVHSLNEVIGRLQPSYLIMDIEGGEYDIFKWIDFQSITKIQFELHPQVLSATAIDGIFEKLQQAGFSKSNLFNFPNNFYFTRP